LLQTGTCADADTEVTCTPGTVCASDDETVESCSWLSTAVLSASSWAGAEVGVNTTVKSTSTTLVDSKRLRFWTERTMTEFRMMRSTCARMAARACSKRNPRIAGHWLEMNSAALLTFDCTCIATAADGSDPLRACTGTDDSGGLKQVAPSEMKPSPHSHNPVRMLRTLGATQTGTHTPPTASKPMMHRHDLVVLSYDEPGWHCGCVPPGLTQRSRAASYVAGDSHGSAQAPVPVEMYPARHVHAMPSTDTRFRPHSTHTLARVELMEFLGHLEHDAA